MDSGFASTFITYDQVFLLLFFLLGIILFAIWIIFSLKKKLHKSSLQVIKSNEALQSSKDLNDTLLKNMPGGFLLIGEDYKIYQVNQRTCDITGYSENELVGEKCDILCPKGQASKECPVWEKGITKFDGMDTFIKCKSGSKCPIYKNAQVLTINGKKYILESYLDIRNIKETEQELKQSNEKLASLFLAMQDIVLELDEEGHYLEIAPTAPNLLFYSRDKLIGKRVDEILPKTAYEPIYKSLKYALDKRLVTNVSYKLKLDGIERWFDATISPKSENSVIFVAKDVTKQRTTQIELEKMNNLKSIGTLAGGIAHDFNNLLTGIYGNLSLAKISIPETHKAYSFLKSAEFSMNRATKLTNQLLTFSKGGNPVKENIGLEELLTEVVSFDLTGSNVKPKYYFEQNLWNVNVDKSQIQQVFSNLTINANQAMPKGGYLHYSLRNVKVEDDLKPNLIQGNYVKISIRDEGIGIDPKSLEHIFEPYFTTKDHGNGLGLATVYSIISKHNGFIEVQSEKNIGTVFDIYLPVSHQDNEANSSSINDLKNNDSESQKLKVLVMDDELIIRNIATNIIENLGHQVKVCNDGESVIDEYESSLITEKYDLVIMDLTVPGRMGGAEATKEILKIDRDAQIIVSSGYSASKILSNYSQYGFIDSIEKPYTLEKIDEVLSKYAK